MNKNLIGSNEAPHTVYVVAFLYFSKNFEPV